jgi:glycosyltransferase involved in cell wall biosynthesis
VYFEACNLVREAIPSLRIVAFGNEAPDPTIPVPVGTEFHKAPPQAEIPHIYAKCDVWLFASRIDSFGLPILEAMACKTPVIGVPVGAAPELLCGGAGILLSGSSPREMADAILGFFELDANNRLSMANAAYEKAHSYTWSDATDRLESELLRICN